MCSPKTFLHIRHWYSITFVWITLLLTATTAKAQSMVEYDEVPVFFNIQRIGTTEMPALISGEKAYLPVIDLFSFLKINIISENLNSVHGTFIQPEAKFLFDVQNNRVVYQEKNFELAPESLIITGGNLYLRSDYFGEIFGLNCAFTFRSLSVVLSTDLELPVLREMKLDQIRNNLSNLKGDFKTDTLFKRRNPLFYFGTADYAFVTSGGNAETPRDTRLSFGLGGIVAGGETNVILNYHSNAPLSGRQQYYLWRYVDNDQPFARQFLAGKIRSQSISSIYAPVVGVQVTNAPTTYRRSFGSYTLSNYTEPNWTVELYVNGVLINFTKADAAGFYTFNVPLSYGNTVIKLRQYGPFGQERLTEQNINIPFNFLPENEFEYTASGGVVEDGQGTKFGRFSGNYGLSRHITVGGGVEYLSSVTSGSTIPFVNTSFRLLPNLLVSGEYDFNVRSRAIMSYNLPSGLQLEVQSNWYKKGQTAINTLFLEDHKVTLSFPLRGRRFSAYTRLLFQEIKLVNTRYTNTEWMLSGVVGNVNASANTFGLFMPGRDPYIYTNFSLGIRTFKNVLLTQQLQYEYTNKKVIGIKTELEKRIFVNGYLNISYEKNFSSTITNVELGLRYDFSFAQTRSTVRKTNDVYRVLQSINGSLIHDAKSGITDFNNYTSIGKGAILLLPFLDMNGNGKRDRNEQSAAGLQVRVTGGRVEHLVKNNTILITDIEAYTNYNVELDPSGFELVSWKLLKKKYTVAIEPNMVKNIDIPVSVVGEVSGRVQLNDKNEKGIGGAIIAIYDTKGKKIAQTTSELDGYFSYLGLMPGNYTAEIDAEKLKKMNFITDKTSFTFIIVASREGTFIDNLKFILRREDDN
jgi:hypothetical protein